MTPLSVSALNTQIKSLIETTFLQVSLEGEISNFTLHSSSGHLYFSLKDEKSVISCVMFRGNAKSLDFTPQNGEKVLLKGTLTVYIPRGSYQIIAQEMRPSGQGELAQKYEALKKRLEKKGYFAKSLNPKPLPAFPKKIALLTSLNGAALQDMLRVANTRWNLVHFVVFDTLVQGEEAKHKIAQNIAYADSFYGSKEAFDIIVISRGGGSMEDLWAFNEEIVAEAIFRARTPIISAVGHEIDFVISDFVADMRAPTPSACMEMILPDKKEWFIRLDDLAQALDFAFGKRLKKASEALSDLRLIYESISYETKLKNHTKQLELQKELLNNAINARLKEKSQNLALLSQGFSLDMIFKQKKLILESLKQALLLQNPQNKIKAGYAQISRKGAITPLQDLHIGDEFELCDGKLEAKAKLI